MLLYTQCALAVMVPMRKAMMAPMAATLADDHAIENVVAYILSKEPAPYRLKK